MSNSSLTIIALGEGITAAKLLAEHRSAELKLAETVSDLADAISTSVDPVLLSLHTRISFRELSEIMLTAQNVAVPCGFIDSWRGPESSVRHARNMLTWSPLHEPGISFWNSDRTTTDISGSYSNLKIIEHNSPFPEAILNKSRRTLGIITHGNGVDSPFGDGGFLCGRLAASDAVLLDNYFPCGVGGECIRGKFVDGELKNPHRYSTADVGGDIIVWGTCYNALTADSIFDPRGGLLVGLLDNHGNHANNRTRHVITLVRAVEVNDIAVLAACAQIEAGQTLGSVLAGLNESYLGSASIGAYPPWILFGDPTIRIESSHSVTRSRDGEMVRPGLSLFDLSADRNAAEVILLVKEPADAPADLWFRRVGQGREGLLLRRDTGSVITVRSTIPRPAELKLVQRELASAERLTFSDMLFRLAAGNPAATSFRYDHQVAGRIHEFLQHLKALQLSPHPFEDLSGDADSFVRFLVEERGSWRAMNEELFELLILAIHDQGSIIQHHYAFVPPSLAESKITECPYCGSPAELSFIRFPGPISARQNLRCGRCTIISDADADCGPVLLNGPETVKAGQTAEYYLELAAVPEHGVEFGCAQLFAQRPPWPFADFGTLAVVEDISDTCVFELQWTPPADAPPGRYYLLAPMVIDGAVFVGRRPVLITPVK